MLQCNLNAMMIFRYIIFCIIAMLVNLGAQRVVLMLGSELPILVVAIAIGTLAGLLLKFVLDKQWIFDQPASDVRSTGKQFILYSSMGLITTVIFWGTELAFWLHWQTDAMRELGAILGLTLGNTLKYFLDRRFVFTKSVGGR